MKPRTSFRFRWLFVLGLVRPAAAQGRVAVDSTPTLSMRTGAIEADTIRPIGVERLSSGGYVVADVHGNMLFFFDSTGHLSPDGPHKHADTFQHIAWIGACGTDSLFVWDLMQEQMFVLDSHATIHRHYALDTRGELGPPTVMSCSKGPIFAYQAPPARHNIKLRDGPIVRGRESVAVADGEGRTLTRIPDVWTGEFVATGGGAVPRPLGKATALAIYQERLVVGTADSGFVETFGLDGVAVDSMRLPFKGETTIAGSYDRALDDVVALVPAQVAAKARAALAAMPKPDRAPAYRGMIADEDGALWFLLSQPGQNTRLAMVPSHSQQVEIVSLPMAFTPTSIGHDYILGYCRSPNGEYNPMVLRVRR